MLVNQCTYPFGCGPFGTPRGSCGRLPLGVVGIGAPLRMLPPIPWKLPGGCDDRCGCMFGGGGPTAGIAPGGGAYPR